MLKDHSYYGVILSNYQVNTAKRFAQELAEIQKIVCSEYSGRSWDDITFKNDFDTKLRKIDSVKHELINCCRDNRGHERLTFDVCCNNLYHEIGKKDCVVVDTRSFLEKFGTNLPQETSENLLKFKNRYMIIFEVPNDEEKCFKDEMVNKLINQSGSDE